MSTLARASYDSDLTDEEWELVRVRYCPRIRRGTTTRGFPNEKSSTRFFTSISMAALGGDCRMIFPSGKPCSATFANGESRECGNRSMRPSATRFARPRAKLLNRPPPSLIASR